MNFPTKNDLPALKKLFIDVFSEETQFVDMMFQHKLSIDNTFVIRKDKKIVSMAYTMYFDCKIGDIFGKCVYIYGVGTDANYRGMGYMSEIMNDIYTYYKEKEILFLYLVPADSELFKMYEKFGYKTAFYLDKKEIPVSSAEFISTQHGNFHSDYLKYISQFQNVIIRSEADNLLILNECEYIKINESGFLYYTNNKKTYLREAYIYNEKDFLEFVDSLSVDVIEFTTPEEAKTPYAMINIISDKIKYSDFDKKSYTNLNFD